MKKIITTLFVFTTFVCVANAQLFVNGDINKDGTVSVSDITELVDMLNGKKSIQTPESLLAGTWRSLAGEEIVLKADGTTEYAGASTFKYKNIDNQIYFYDIKQNVVKLYNVIKANAAYLKLNEVGDYNNVIYYNDEVFNDIFLSKRQSWQETVFMQKQPVAIPLNIDTEGVTVTSVGREFMNTILDVSYNMYEQGELDWKNGTQLVFTAKDNITGIVINGQNNQYASADKGVYNNGVWTGTLDAGETLTLTSSDVISIHSIIILYNGAELNIEEEEEETEATITYNITKTSWSKIGDMNGESIGTVSCNLKNFNHYMFQIINDEDPSQVITFADLLSIEGDMKCYSPDANGYDLYNGQNYTLHIYAYDTPQYGALAAAEAEYHFVGTGKAATVYNEEITIANVGLETNAQGLGYNLNGTEFDITFSAPVSSIKAWWAEGLDGSTNFTTVKKSADGTIWTIIMPESVTTEEGAINVNITANDAEGHQLRHACDNKPYAFDVVVSPEE